MFDKLIECVKEMDMGCGLFFLVDMGFFISFVLVILECIGILVCLIDMVFIVIVIEVVWKFNIFDMEFDSIYDFLKDFWGYGGYNFDDDIFDFN